MNVYNVQGDAVNVMMACHDGLGNNQAHTPIWYGS